MVKLRFGSVPNSGAVEREREFVLARERERERERERGRWWC